MGRGELAARKKTGCEVLPEVFEGVRGKPEVAIGALRQESAPEGQTRSMF
jgi:hypothetical protein